MADTFSTTTGTGASGNMTGTGTTASADAIERDIEQTQNSISDTVEQLQRRLNPRAIVDAVLGDDDQAGQQLVTAARNNPLAVGLIGLGALLLASGKTPSLGMMRRDLHGNDQSGQRDQHSGKRGWGRFSRHDPHVSYVEYMAKVEKRVDEDDAAYARRRDIARANYFMLDQNHDEDEGSFRTRLNEAQAALRNKTSAFGDKLRRASHDGRDGIASARRSMMDSGKSAYGRAADWTSDARNRASDQFDANPAVGGLIAAAVGAAFGAALPPTQMERQKLGGVSAKARDMIAAQKDKLVDKADTMLASGGNGSGSGEMTGGKPTSSREPTMTQA